MRIPVYNDPVPLSTRIPFPPAVLSMNPPFRSELGTTIRSGGPELRAAGTPCTTLSLCPDNRCTDPRPTRAAPPRGMGRRAVGSDPFFGGRTSMAIPAQRIIHPDATRNFGRFGDAIDVPPLTDVQTKSYERFLQLDVPPEKRTNTG